MHFMLLTSPQKATAKQSYNAKKDVSTCIGACLDKSWEAEKA